LVERVPSGDFQVTVSWKPVINFFTTMPRGRFVVLNEEAAKG
jgi:hypothetical protein